MRTAGRWLERHPTAALLAVLAAGAALHVWASRKAWASPDGVLYMEFASLLREPGYFLSAESFWGNYWPAGYGMFLSAVGMQRDSALESVALLSVVLNLATAVGCWLLMRRFSTAIRLVVVALVLVSPDLLWSSRAIGYEALLTCLLVWSLALAWQIGQERATWLAPALSGALVMLAVIVQSRVVFLVPVLAVLAWRRGRPARIGFAAGVLAIAIPWIVRGYLAYGRFSLLTTNGPINVWIGSNPEATTGGYMDPPVTPNGYVQGALAFFKESPYAFLELSLHRLARLVTPIADNFDLRPRFGVPYASWAFLFCAALVAGLLAWWIGCLWLGSRAMPRVGPIAIVATLYLLLALPFLVEPRYRVPVTPFLVCVLVPTSVLAWRTVRMRHAGRPPAAA